MRNFGIMSGRPALGGASDRPSTTRDAIIPRDSNSFASRFPPDALVNCDGLDRHSFIQGEDLELGAKCLFFGVLTLIGLVLFVSWFVISNFVA